MNILLVTETYPPEINGVARTLAQMADGLAALGHAITLVCPAHAARLGGGATAGNMTVDLCQVRGLPLPGYAGLQIGLPARRRISDLLERRQIDVAYIATEGPLGHSALRACQRRGIPALTGMHTNFHQYSAHYGAGILGPLLLRYLRRFHNRAAGTLVPTRILADELADVGFARLHTWPRGVHTELFSPRRRDDALRNAWGLRPDDIAVMYVGRLAPEKNLDTAFRAFAAIKSARPSARFILVGGGPAEQSLREAHPDAIFAGAKSGGELARHYASGDLFLFPSETETFGNVTLEAMASGLAVVAFDLAAAHELILHGHNGVLAAPGLPTAFIDQAVRCATEPGLQRKLKRHARETALQQDWPRLIVRLEQLFLALIEARPDDDFEGTVESIE
ncbi:MAG: glycosyltransferase family 1 protein [Gammaproteobacteria bacterium]|mgnify:CR=1 FL=1|nr:glycosyltransferase family 1 protein [Gammaproteobacteria bacterium]MCB1817529.1 glycosyltransferase family 1 protein [Gammaproteobacteria bacterium]MCP5430823.1 glycosyltransferase family 1 protein [Chromatiaceae bacterium]HOP17013.1 glycosyltransferase family 1 protein [Gammaproteobacteria bacterium]HPQ26798.1 glycosyltransferase family 1 protein [Gammaproteobacteria bacterium]